MVRRADRRIARHFDFVLLHQRGGGLHVHRIGPHHDEAVVRNALGQLLGENRIAVGADNAIETIVFVQLLGYDRSHPAHSDHHCIGHRFDSPRCFPEGAAGWLECSPSQCGGKSNRPARLLFAGFAGDALREDGDAAHRQKRITDGLQAHNPGHRMRVPAGENNA